MNYKVILPFFIGILGAQLCFSQDSSLKDLVIEEGVKGTTKSKEGKVHFQAKKASFNKLKKTLEMQKDVKIQTEEGVRLETDQIKWDQNKDRFFTDKDVEITKDKNIQIQGKGLEAQPSLKKAKIEKEVKVKIPQEDSSFIMITCKGPLEIDYQKGEAVFYNDVEVNQKGSQLFSDKATMYFDLNSRSLKKIVAEGEVRIIKGKDTSYSKKATYDAASKKITLEGSPRLIIFPKENQGQNFFK